MPDPWPNSRWVTPLEGMKNLPKMYGLDKAAHSAGLTTDRLKELCDAGLAPHYYVDGEGPLFRISELKAWMKDTLVTTIPGRMVPRQFHVYVPEVPKAGQVPPQLVGVDAIRRVPIMGRMSGVYFLVGDSVVVYVGQSVNVWARIATHFTEDRKNFSTAWFIPVVRSRLDEVERLFIKLLRPAYNQHSSDYEACRPDEVTRRWKESVEDEE